MDNLAMSISRKNFKIQKGWVGNLKWEAKT
jgi:hypothetical protein